MTDVDEKQSPVRRSYEAIDRGNIDAMDELVAENYVNHNAPNLPGLPTGREGLKQAFRIFQAATPGHHEIEDQIAEGDKVVTRLIAYGKHQGDFPGGIKATGAEVTMSAVAIHRIENGQLAEHWANSDELGFMVQLGVISMSSAS